MNKFFKECKLHGYKSIPVNLARSPLDHKRISIQTYLELEFNNDIKENPYVEIQSSIN